MSKRTLVGAAVAALTLAIAAPGAPAQTAPPSTAPPPTAPPAVVKVKVGDNFFKKKKVTVPAGTTIRWKNIGRVTHNIVPNKGKLFGINPMAPGKVYKFTFEQPGKYKYYCSLHGGPNVGQHGTIVVTESPLPPPTTAAPPPT